MENNNFNYQKNPSGNGYQGNGDTTNGYQGNAYQSNGPTTNGYQGNGYQGNGYQGNGYQGSGYQGSGYQGAAPTVNNFTVNGPMGNSYTGKFGYQGSPQFAPLSAWGYFGYSLLFCIPVVGFICLIIFSVSDKNINRRSFARSFWILTIITVVLVIITAVLGIPFLQEAANSLQ